MSSRELKQGKNRYRVDKNKGRIEVNGKDPYDDFMFTNSPPSSEKKVVFPYNDARGSYETYEKVDEKLLDPTEMAEIQSACSNYTRGTLQAVAMERQRILSDQTTCSVKLAVEFIVSVAIIVVMFITGQNLWIKIAGIVVVVLFLLGEMMSGSKKVIKMIESQNERMSNLDYQIGSILIRRNRRRKKAGYTKGYWINGRHAFWIEFRFGDINDPGIQTSALLCLSVLINPAAVVAATATAAIPLSLSLQVPAFITLSFLFLIDPTLTHSHVRNFLFVDSRGRNITKKGNSSSRRNEISVLLKD